MAFLNQKRWCEILKQKVLFRVLSAVCYGDFWENAGAWKLDGFKALRIYGEQVPAIERVPSFQDLDFQLCNKRTCIHVLGAPL